MHEVPDQIMLQLAQLAPCYRNPDNTDIDEFASRMKQKMYLSGLKGRSGWRDASAETISQMLIEHIAKGDPVDVANFCMMLYIKGERINVTNLK